MRVNEIVITESQFAEMDAGRRGFLKGVGAAAGAAALGYGSYKLGPQDGKATYDWGPTADMTQQDSPRHQSPSQPRPRIDPRLSQERMGDEKAYEVAASHDGTWFILRRAGYPHVEHTQDGNLKAMIGTRYDNGQFPISFALYNPDTNMFKFGDDESWFRPLPGTIAYSIATALISY